LWGSLDHRQALNHRLGAHWRKPWPVESTLRLQTEDNCWQDLAASADPPVLFVRAA
jgi:hypothetical protein